MSSTASRCAPSWSSRSIPTSRIRSGSKAELWFDTERVHVFDPATGENLTLNRDRTSGDGEAAGVSGTGPPDETASG